MKLMDLVMEFVVVSLDSSLDWEKSGSKPVESSAQHLPLGS